ncbi:NAD-dependent epimerase/dehydratase family protein [Paracoccus shanxieyensis]|uniref:NAD-dependent epimerase/dehydratase family protein n=1 Tax=Paracoccus shanxieyensis TaxID=2675752 RepID=A0A6L6IWZ8_9RHOB|nr:NAD(P)-dependent oxidoreductase [Paracoccus shanxieyensis]MTH64138.1 NAD-dependent epimerase/dehydratase family protein [Paracoccus shanxieyensis]MTH87282.1 NAD-dependent epimerase/dehydratase family protein [Paracoccus shanxieyensis]
MTQIYDTILITGAAGRLGSELRLGLAPLARKLRLADMAPIQNLQAHEEAVTFDLGDEAAVMAAVEGVDVIVHFGGAPLERPWDEILNANIRGSYHIYEAARKHGVKRVVYASSVHAIGYHRLEDHIDTNAPHRPDSLYGLSKCFVEDLGRLYWDKFGIESVALRIFSSFPEPADRRMLWSWLSFDDCVRLVTAALSAPMVGFSLSFGMSDNKVKPVDNGLAGHLGYYPQDTTEPFRAGVEGKTPALDPKAPAVQHLGGWFVDLGHPDDEAK